MLNIDTFSIDEVISNILEDVLASSKCSCTHDLKYWGLGCAVLRLTGSKTRVPEGVLGQFFQLSAEYNFSS